MRCFILMLVFSLITLCGEISNAQTQSHNYRGNLVKVNMTAKSVSLSDTLGSWYDIYLVGSTGKYTDEKAYYYDHLTLKGNSYLLKDIRGNGSGPGNYLSWGNRILEGESQKTKRAFSSSGDVWCGMVNYLYTKTEVIPVCSGAWLINGVDGSAFINDNDSLKVLYAHNGYDENTQALEERLVAIIGKVSDRYLAVLKGGPYAGYEYRLVDLSHSPDIAEGSSTPINFYGFPDGGTPYWGSERQLFRRAAKISDALYLFQYEFYPGLHFFKFNDTSFTYIKTLSDGPEPVYTSHDAHWIFRNNKLYIDGFRTYVFNPSDTTFINKKELPGLLKVTGETAIDWDFNYVAQIDGDTLRIYDINKECYINAINIKGVNKPFRPVIDYPYVYLHQTIVEENSSILSVEENNSIVKSYSLSAYPNPFNPVTMLEFNIPSAGKIELKIYDALGKEVTTLVNEERNEGRYKVQFNASQLPSGIYLCRMSAGNYNVTKKVVLLK
ncbi:MAG: T9SS type A sorting domain-containing protein [Acidobacteriota bacterium]